MNKFWSCVAMAGGVAGLVACGSGGDTDSLPPAAPTSAASTPTAALTTPVKAPPAKPVLTVAGWRAGWETAQEAYYQKLRTWGSQVTFLTKHKATTQQVGIALPAPARAVSQASTVFVAAIDKAAPLMPQRADVRKAAANLRAAVVAEGKAMAALVACGPKYACQFKTYPAISAVAGKVVAAVKAVPAS